MKVPSTTSGERSARMLRSFGRGLSSRSSVSSLRLTLPLPTMIVSVVSNARVRACITPFSTAKSPNAQRTATVRSLVSRNFNASAISSPASSISRLLTWPRPIPSITSPSAVPRMPATELPVPASDALPPTRPMALWVSCAVGNSLPRSRPRTAMSAFVRITSLRASMRTVERMSPSATPKFSGSSRSSPASRSRCASMSSMGSVGALMRCAFQRTSASIARSLVRSYGVSGSTRASAASAAASARCSALAASSPPVCGGAPTKPARSSKSSRLDTRLASSRGRLRPTVTAADPPRSLSPTRPVKSS